MLVLHFVALWFILRGDLFYVLPCVILFLYFSVLLALRLPRLGKRELILVIFVRLFDLRLFGFVCFLFLLVSGKGCGLQALPGLFSYLFCDCGTPWAFLLLFFLCGSDCISSRVLLFTFYSSYSYFSLISFLYWFKHILLSKYYITLYIVAHKK